MKQNEYEGQYSGQLSRKDHNHFTNLLLFDRVQKLATRNLMSFINEQQRVNLTGTTVRGLSVIRIAVLVYRVHQERMEMLLEDLKAGLAAVVFGVAD